MSYNNMQLLIQPFDDTEYCPVQPVDAQEVPVKREVPAPGIKRKTIPILYSDKRSHVSVQIYQVPHSTYQIHNHSLLRK